MASKSEDLLFVVLERKISHQMQSSCTRSNVSTMVKCIPVATHGIWEVRLLGDSAVLVSLIMKPSQRKHKLCKPCIYFSVQQPRVTCRTRSPKISGIGHAWANSGYQALFPPPTCPGYEATSNVTIVWV